MSVDCYLGIGSNLGHSIDTIQQGLAALAPAVTLVTCSRLYGSKPHGPQDQPDYVNAVAHVTTDLPAEDLLVYLQAIEQQQGRERKERWGARTLDLDILLYGNYSIQSETLIIPHPRMLERCFVLYPLFEIAPHLQFPNGSALSDKVDALMFERIAAQPERLMTDELWILEYASFNEQYRVG